MTRERGLRGAVAIVFALVAGLVAVRAQFIVLSNGGDHRILWHAAHVLLSGGNAYAPQAEKYLTLYYPMPSVLAVMPLAWLPVEIAATAFATLSAGLLGYAITREGFERVPILFSIPFLCAAQFAQTSTLVFALGITPLLAGLTVIKPNLGAALFTWRPSARTIFVGGLVVLASLAADIRWPLRFLAAVRSSPGHHAPVTVGLGALALCALFRWRRPEARLLVAMALIPHALFFYDELPLFLIAQTRREAMVMALTSWMGLFGWMATSHGPTLSDMQQWSVAAMYIPAVAIVLLRPNVSKEYVNHEATRRASQVPMRPVSHG